MQGVALIVHLWLLQQHRSGMTCVLAYSSWSRRYHAGNSASTAPAAAAAAPDHSAQTGADTSKPTTNIQIRLADGTKLKGTFNLTQTIGDVRK